MGLSLVGYCDAFVLLGLPTVGLVRCCFVVYICCAIYRFCYERVLGDCLWILVVWLGMM